jgi:hypothetical protein
MIRKTVMGLVLALAGSSCGDDEATPPQGCVIRRCLWNPATQQFDRDCVDVVPDGGPSACDGGVGTDGLGADAGD